MTAEVVGRLAPSPTGAQHVGNAADLLACLALGPVAGRARACCAMEDIDSPRVKAGAAEQGVG